MHTSRDGEQHLVWIGPLSLGVEGLVPHLCLAISVLVEVENMRGRVTGETSDVVGEPALPVPDLGEHTQARCSTLSGVCLSHERIKITGVAVMSEGNKKDNHDKSEIIGERGSVRWGVDAGVSELGLHS